MHATERVERLGARWIHLPGLQVGGLDLLERSVERLEALADHELREGTLGVEAARDGHTPLVGDDRFFVAFAAREPLAQVEPVAGLVRLGLNGLPEHLDVALELGLGALSVARAVRVGVDEARWEHALRRAARERLVENEAVPHVRPKD